MAYLLYRIKESKGFIAKRAIQKACLVALITYGQAAMLDHRIVIPEMIYLAS